MTGRDDSWLPVGMSCILIGAAAAWVASAYPVGSVTAMGPGFVPLVVAALLITLGGLVLVRRGADAPATEAGADAPRRMDVLRPILAIGLSVLVFGLTIERLGLLAAVFLVVLVAGYAMEGARPLPTLAMAVAFALAAALIFVVLLGLPIRLGPKFL